MNKKVVSSCRTKLEERQNMKLTENAKPSENAKLSEKAYINRIAIIGHAIIDAVLVLAYAVEVMKGSRTILRQIILIFFCV